MPISQSLGDPATADRVNSDSSIDRVMLGRPAGAAGASDSMRLLRIVPSDQD